jgi:predicted AlkP superfamily pyrophosphatase or phosphodiesterase
MKYLLALVFLLVVVALAAYAPAAQPTTRPIPQIDHVLIISIDGLRPDVLLRADAPRIHQLCHEGTFTFWARSTPASITLPTHVSMLTGVTPEKHAILWNGDLPLSQPVYPAVPTIFELAHRAGRTTAMVVGKSKFTVLDKPGTIDFKFIPTAAKSDDAEVTSNALRILHAHQPELMFVHLPGVDNVGHASGWGTPEQLAAVASADHCIGQIVDELRALDLNRRTLIIITADHGGAGRTHGAEDPRSRSIPWIAVGPGVRKDFDLTLLAELNVEVYDTFATACAVLAIPIPERIDGKFTEAMLEDRELLRPGAPPSMQPTTRIAATP